VPAATAITPPTTDVTTYPAAGSAAPASAIRTTSTANAE
jgi:hypothetical protein